MFRKVLIANRGEIACRILRSCQRLGIATVAVHSDIDAGSLAVRRADQAIAIGPAPARESYLQGGRIIAAALASGAEAIHPGYGFLSENADFAEACLAAGLVFIGPPAAAIRAMGSKSGAKQLMQAAGVPVVPGYHGERQDLATLALEAGRIGYPLLIKASAGGGGKGMRIVHEAAGLPEALAACQREAQASFGNDAVLLERYLQRPRHIEVQVFGAATGQVISLFDRDCSAQRRHQKVIEEAPAAGLAAAQREAMAQAACAAARAVGYVGAGTVEFIVAPAGDWYFMEMNTRLQVEHPVTEMVTGLDLVEWQLRVAAGEALPLAEVAVACHGHAIEARLYAEEPERGFLPSVGRLARFRLPAARPWLRTETGLVEGDAVSAHYDPMLAKLVAWGETRALAIERLRQALSEVQVAGPASNVGFLQRLVAHPAFMAGGIDTGFIEREGERQGEGEGEGEGNRGGAALLSDDPALPAGAPEAAALHVLRVERDALAAGAAASDPHSPWHDASGWRLNGTLRRRLEFRHAGQLLGVDVTYAPRGAQGAHGVQLESAAGRVVADESPAGDDSFTFSLAGRRVTATVLELAGTLHVFTNGRHVTLQRQDALAQADVHGEHHGGLTAPMSGAVLALCVAPGATVQKGEALLVMEAMKMEHTLRAPAAGVLRAYLCAVGQQVSEGEALLEFEARP